MSDSAKAPKPPGSTESGTGAIEYWHKLGKPDQTHRYLWPVIKNVAEGSRFEPARAFDLGWGNGSTSEMLRELGFEGTGVDPSEIGISRAKSAFPRVTFHLGSAYDDLAATYGTFPLVVSLEVIEHLYDPRRFLRTFYRLMAKDGWGVISTPYHGYWKNLALALTGKWDKHLQPLRLHGHIKFFSSTQLREILHEEGFRDVRIDRVGRIPSLAKSMVAIVRK